MISPTLSGFTQSRGSCNRTRLLEGFLVEGSLKEVLLRRVLRRRLVRVSVETQVLRRRLEGRSTPFRRVRPPSRAP